MVVPSKTKIVCHFSTLVLTCGQPHTLQIVPRDEYDNPTNNSMSLRDEHNYSLSIHEVSASSFLYAGKPGSLLGTSLPALVFPLTSEPSRLYFIVHVCLGSVRLRLKGNLLWSIWSHTLLPVARCPRRQEQWSLIWEVGDIQQADVPGVPATHPAFSRLLPCLHLIPEPAHQ